VSAGTEVDHFYMGVALELARKGIGRTSPNPMVGAVVVQAGRIVGRGFHPKAGDPHAEVLALEQAGTSAKGATLYVSLEPCAHRGRTPPCTEAVLASGVARVVAAMEDPNPLVKGQGLRRLREAGISVDAGVREPEARRLNEAFCLSIREGRAFAHLKLAATLDGRIATHSGDSRWITSPESRARAHDLRARCGAILIGVGTAAADDPRLTVRLEGEPERRVLRVVLDPRLRAPERLSMLSGEEAAHTLLACREEAEADRGARLRARGLEVLSLPASPLGGMDLRALLTALYRRGIMEVLVEGGGETSRAFLDQGLVDRFHGFYSLRLLGGRESVPMVGGPGPDRIDQAVRLESVEVERIGPDLYVTGRPARR
jgi:diaminohydroxyphosphoribosylaminopyrimidine deaminase / 5-amino-6-(5-phosphoribosylamino)uracil reductase